MYILFPIGAMFLTSATLIILRYLRPNYKYPWMLAVVGATLALVAQFILHIQLPQSFALASWQPATLFAFSPTWLVDGISWPYALCLTVLEAAVICTSVVRAENNPIIWAGTLLLTGLGILAVTAENPLTLILIWSAIDLAEFFIMLKSTEGKERIPGVVIAFATRVAGTGLVLWAILVSTTGGSPMDFHFAPEGAGVYLLIAVGLRLGIFPLRLPYRKDNVLQRGFGTILQLVSATASLSLLARIPISSFVSSLQPYFLVLAAVAALYSGWMWLRASDEILGRPFWIMGIASFSVAASLRGNPTGSISWGIILILGGGLLFLFSARQRKILWLPLLGLWSLSTLPFSLTASAWETGNQNSWLFVIPFLPAQALIIAGYIRHSLHLGETSLESQERWNKYLYPTGLFLLASSPILLGLWGWEGAHNIGILWVTITVIALSAGVTALAVTILGRLIPATTSSQWTRMFRIEWAYLAIAGIYGFFRRIADVITSSLEGEGGLLWSLLLLVLILSVLSTR